jgi:mono/diheme cytochrome c family protein
MHTLARLVPYRSFGDPHALLEASRTSRGKRERLMKAILALAWVSAMQLWAIPVFAAGDAAAGKEVYSKKCASCHGTAGEAKESLAKALKVEIRHLGSQEVQAKSDADLKKITLEGTGKMKGIAGIDAKAADDLVAYLRTLKQ